MQMKIATEHYSEPPADQLAIQLINFFNYVLENNTTPFLNPFSTEDRQEYQFHQLFTAILKNDEGAATRYLLAGAQEHSPMAVKHTFLTFGRILLAKGNLLFQACGENAFQWAWKNEQEDIVELLLPYVSIGHQDSSENPIIFAAINGSARLMKLFLDDGRVDPAAVQNQAIRWAAAKNFVDGVRLLLADSRVDPEDMNCGAFDLAAQNGHTEVLDLLIASPKCSVGVAYLQQASVNEVYSESIRSYFKKKLNMITSLNKAGNLFTLFTQSTDLPEAMRSPKQIGGVIGENLFELYLQDCEESATPGFQSKF